MKKRIAYAAAFLVAIAFPSTIFAAENHIYEEALNIFVSVNETLTTGRASQILMEKEIRSIDENIMALKTVLTKAQKCGIKKTSRRNRKIMGEFKTQRQRKLEEWLHVTRSTIKSAQGILLNGIAPLKSSQTSRPVPVRKNDVNQEIDYDGWSQNLERRFFDDFLAAAVVLFTRMNAIDNNLKTLETRLVVKRPNPMQIAALPAAARKK